MKYDVCIIGGCGHVGLPFGMALADRGKQVALYDINEGSIAKVNAGEMPFKENGADELIKKVVKNKKLVATSDVSVIKQCKVIVMVIGTPVDEHLNPRVQDILRAVREIQDQLTDDHLLIMRSTLYPGMTDKVEAYLRRAGKKTLVAFCPERIMEGHALTELYELPQIVAGCTEEATTRARQLFSMSKEIIELQPLEAELAKLFTNTYRYLSFAIANQFYMIANANQLDFYRIHHAMTKDYPRLKGFAKAGFSAGPCLFKDTMQLSAFADNNFFMGHSAMLVNEGLPGFVVEGIKQKHDLSRLTVGVLGMAFKSDSDDIRESLSYKLKKRLEFEAKDVLCHDPYVKDSRLVSLEAIHKKADIVILAAPHGLYASENWDDKTLVDIWNFYGKGGLV